MMIRFLRPGVAWGACSCGLGSSRPSGLLVGDVGACAVAAAGGGWFDAVGGRSSAPLRPQPPSAIRSAAAPSKASFAAAERRLPVTLKSPKSPQNVTLIVPDRPSTGEGLVHPA